MGLLQLPAEIRLQIFENLPDLSPGRHETIGPNVRLTPAICRVSHQIRQETLPLYASTSSFFIQTDDGLNSSSSRVEVWLAALGEKCLPEVQCVQLSRHWKISQPTRWQGNVGFYIRLQLVDRAWQYTSGTYPVANDIRGMRSESVELLRYVVREKMMSNQRWNERNRLARSDVDFVVAAMEIVALHPISSFDTDQSEAGRKQRRELWFSMEQQLFALGAANGAGQNLINEPGSVFYTPY